jgi:glycosyltransferase involved in cell wall biosynthesis
MPRISILMPVYKGMPYIAEAVESVISQNEQDWEFLISDDGSTDGTRDYLRTLSDPRIKLFFQKNNLGIFGNLNFLLTQTTAPIAKILCQDDKLLPNALGRVAAFMEEQPWCAVSRCLALGNKHQYASDQRWKLENALPARIYPAAVWLVFATFGNIVGNLCKAACRPKMVLEQGGFNQHYPYAGDYEGWMRIAAHHGIALQNEELVFERRHAAQNSVLLNLSNELFAQLTELIEMMATKVASNDMAVLKRHWTIHFLAQRLPKLARQAMAGQYKLACSGLANLPLSISPFAVIVAYPILKFNLLPARTTKSKLFTKILEINKRAASEMRDE